jgi:hypothetical protein
MELLLVRIVASAEKVSFSFFFFFFFSGDGERVGQPKSCFGTNQGNNQILFLI